MDRSAFVALTFWLFPLVVLSTSGCEAQFETSPAKSDISAPSILDELHNAAPGPWKRLAAAPPVAPAALYESTEDSERSLATEVAQADAPESSPPLEFPQAGLETQNLTEETSGESYPRIPNISDSSKLNGDEDPPVPFEAVAPEEQPSVEEAAPETLKTVPPDAVSPKFDLPSVEQPMVSERTILPWADARPHGGAMMAVVQRADEHVRQGFQLAERGATFSARSEFISALQLIAQAYDTQQGTQHYGKALTSGLVALRESNDFLRHTAGKAEMDVTRIVAGHKTPISKGASVGPLSPMVAAQRYYGYAQEQLAAAGAQEASGSMALFGLGKVASASLQAHHMRQLEATAQSMVFYQAALMADAKNFRAANELGVLLVESGNLERARELLIHSVLVSQQPATWHNLAVVHARLGENQLAKQAQSQALALERSGRGGSSLAVKWVDPTTFAQSAPTNNNLQPPATAQAAGSPAKPDPGVSKPAANVAKKGISDWLPWSSQR